MQFYIIHNSYTRNAQLLPDYALKKVNIREGWQMLSDICHLFDITFTGQNKHYNAFHAETRIHYKSKKALLDFLFHYKACLLEYSKRFNKNTIWHQKFEYFLSQKLDKSILSCLPDEGKDTWQVIFYLLKSKSKLLNRREISYLQELLK